MPSISTQPATDPVSRAIAHSALMAGATPVPLVSTSYDIKIRGGLADVVAARTFRNNEEKSIEATLTFPLPVHAVLYSLEARIGGRTVRAVARSKTTARQTYEDAVDKGKTAVLHEELFRGVHMLSIAHIAPGTEIGITARFAVALARVGERILLHIPTTVGDIYGRSGLPDSDELCHAGAEQLAEVKVATDTGEVVLLGRELADGHARVPLDAPIHIEVKGWRPRVLKGRAADGRGVTLTIEPAPEGKVVLSTAILIDHSGSMSELCTANAGLSKHAAAVLGLSEAHDDLREGDTLYLWEFDDQVRNLGRTTAKEWRGHLRKLNGPSGGTEIGSALDEVVASRARDIILVTDGKSYALDVGKLARSGARFTVVLIGEDSLEANVGHLAALTGGEIFVPDGADVANAVRSAVRAMRRPAGDPREAHLCRSGMLMRASWTPDLSAPTSAAPDTDDRAAAAYAASLLLASLNEKDAAVLAEMEGLVTHLTSLVLVDEEGVTQPGLPTTRKVALPTPRTSVHLQSHAIASAPRYCAGASIKAASFPRDMDECAPRARMSKAVSKSARAPRAWEDDEAPRKSQTPEYNPPGELNLAVIAASINWSKLGDDADAGKLGSLKRAKRERIRAAAELPLVLKIAAEVGIAPVSLVLGMMARFMASRDRHASRIARALVGHAKLRPLLRVAQLLGLDGHQEPID